MQRIVGLKLAEQRGGKSEKFEGDLMKVPKNLIRI